MRRLIGLALVLCPCLGLAQQVGIPAVSLETAADGAQTYTLSIQVLLALTALTLLPSLLLSMTAFTRIVIVLAILRQALGTPQTPPNQVLVGLSLFLTLFVMSPVLGSAYSQGVEPYLEGRMPVGEALREAMSPLKEFMLSQTRADDLETFLGISEEVPVDVNDVPLSIVIPSFMTSELKTAFQIGFLIFIPFLIIDLVVASVLMSMGMIMLSPVLISLPFKIMLFVLVDGWSLVMRTLWGSFLT